MAHFDRPDVSGDSRRAQVLDILGAALDAVDPAEAVRRAMSLDGDTLHVGDAVFDLGQTRRVLVVGGGKAGAAMAQAVEEILGERITAGWINVKTGYTAPTCRITIHEAGHPLPNAAGNAGTRAIVDLLHDTTTADLVICLISGGGSALMTLPVEGISLAALEVLTDAMLASGMPIQEINTVRKHLSQVKGGQLARLAHPAAVVALVLSDVVGSPLDVIASGPTVADTSTYWDALEALRRFDVFDTAPLDIRRHLEAGDAGKIAETPKPGDPILERVHTLIVADNARAAEAAQRRAETLGFHTLLLSTYVEGEARDVAAVAAAIGKEIASANRPLPRPACVLMGGETTVHVRGKGKGGRNQELALAAALAIQGWGNIVIASLATDGSDGPTDAAGGVVDGTTVERGAALGLAARAALSANNAYPYLDQVGDLIVTGPTNTNVNDLIAVCVF